MPSSSSLLGVERKVDSLSAQLQQLASAVQALTAGHSQLGIVSPAAAPAGANQPLGHDWFTWRSGGSDSGAGATPAANQQAQLREGENPLAA